MFSVLTDLDHSWQSATLPEDDEIDAEENFEVEEIMDHLEYVNSSGERVEEEDESMEDSTLDHSGQVCTQPRLDKSTCPNRQCFVTIDASTCACQKGYKILGSRR